MKQPYSFDKVQHDDRAQHVRQMLANFQMEELGPDEADKQLLQAYIDGTTTLDDLLDHARTYAERHRGR